MDNWWFPWMPSYWLQQRMSPSTTRLLVVWLNFYNDVAWPMNRDACRGPFSSRIDGCSNPEWQGNWAAKGPSRWVQLFLRSSLLMISYLKASHNNPFFSLFWSDGSLSLGNFWSQMVRCLLRSNGWANPLIRKNGIDLGWKPFLFPWIWIPKPSRLIRRACPLSPIQITKAGIPKQDYYVSGPPSFFLIDLDNKLLLRPTSTEQMDAWVDWKIGGEKLNWTRNF